MRLTVKQGYLMHCLDTSEMCDMRRELHNDPDFVFLQQQGYVVVTPADDLDDDLTYTFTADGEKAMEEYHYWCDANPDANHGY